MKGKPYFSCLQAVCHKWIMPAGAGILLGILSRFLDLYTSSLGNIFSQLTVWVFLGTLTAVRSSSVSAAAVRIFCFNTGMLCAYYVTAEQTGGTYSGTVICGWSFFSLFTIPAAMAVRRSISARCSVYAAAVIIVCFNLSAALILAGRIHGSDVVLTVLTIWLLLRKNTEKRGIQ